MEPRKTRHDKGSIKANDRDIIILTVVAEQYAMRFDHVVQIARAYPGPGANPDGISVSAVRQMVDRCKIRVENKQGYGLKSGINEVSSTVSKELWRQRGCSDTWNDQPFTT